ncbi:MAG: GNAT family N-acetyltransferase [Parachlamydiales bacterium]|nr:GNAT family N-acetyltransferase [Parachlamydiales bacterium]
MDSVLVQLYQEKYQKQVMSLISEIQQKEFNINITPDRQPDLKEISDFYQKGKGNFWIALDNNMVVGTIALLDIGNDEAALRKMFVHKDYRGKGVAKKLLEILLQWARKKHIKTIYLGTTPAFLFAHRFYEKNGFIEIQKEELPKHFPVMEVDKKFYKFNIVL